MVAFVRCEACMTCLDDRAKSRGRADLGADVRSQKNDVLFLKGLGKKRQA